MSLKTRLVTAISMFCLVLSLMMVGVWAVQTATVNIGGTVSFNAKDIYAKITGEVDGAETTPTLLDLEYSAKGEPDENTLASWSNDLTFTDAGLITFTITVQNLSGERSLFVIVNDKSTTHTNIEKALSVKNPSTATATTYTSGSEIEITKSTTAVFTFTFDVIDENAGATLTYNFAFSLRDEKQEPETSSVDLKYDSDAGYYYVEMGTYNEAAVRWRLVGVDGSQFTGSTAPTSGTGTFILETNLSKYHAFGSVDEDYTMGNNDYSTSYIREYLTGNSSYALDYNGAVDNTDQGSFLADFGITESDAVYSAIQARDMASLYEDIGWAIGNVGGGQQYAPPAGTTQYAPYTTTPKTSVGEDKLWLMSVEEIYTMVGGGTLTNGTIPSSWASDLRNKLVWNDEYYWLRSPRPDYSSLAFRVYRGGDWFNDFVDAAHAVRPAFNLVF